MPSVAAVFSADFRASPAQPQPAVPDAEGAFSEVLYAIADTKAPTRPEAPRVPERRAETQARPGKPEADAGRQARRHAPDDTGTEAKTADPAAAVAPVAAEGDGESGDADTQAAEADAEALLMLGLIQAKPEAPATPQTADAQSSAESLAAGAPLTAAESEAEAPAGAVASPSPSSSPSIAAAEAEAQPQAAASKQAASAAAPLAAATETESDAITALPKISASASSLPAKPLAAASAESQAPAPNPPAPAATAPAPPPAPLEMLQAAISKQAQLALGADHREPAPETAKPLVSSNAVAPNFAMTAQVNAPVTAQTQTVADSARVPVEQLAVEIATRAGKGERRFDIRLDPPELGRIDVRLEIDSKGNTTTRLIVERAETLDMLQRDARGLEKALQNAGLKTDAGGLQFSLQQDAQTQQGPQHHTADMRGRTSAGPADAEIITEIATGNAALAAQLRGGVDIRI